MTGLYDSKEMRPKVVEVNIKRLVVMQDLLEFKTRSSYATQASTLRNIEATETNL